MSRALALMLTTFACLVASAGRTSAPAPDVRYISATPNTGGPRCDRLADVAAVLPDPTAVPDAVGEWVSISTLESERLDLTDWALVTGGRKRYLDGLAVEAGTDLVMGGADVGASQALGTLRLRNGHGSVQLLDPCGVEVSGLTWFTAPGETARRGALEFGSVVVEGRPLGPSGLGTPEG